MKQYLPIALKTEKSKNLTSISSYSNNELFSAFLKSNFKHYINSTLKLVFLITLCLLGNNLFSLNNKINISDNFAPNVICQNITIQLDSNGLASIIALDIDGGSFDSSGIESMKINKTNFDCSNLGQNSVTLTITDRNGNVSSCTATVTVEDNIAPIINCPQEINTNVINTNCIYIMEDFTSLANYSDNCESQGVTISQIPALGTEVSLENESVTVTLKATDAFNNSKSCSFEVRVRCSRALDIPQFISPNGDGINDTWEIKELINFPNNTTKVFNRWGVLVFEQKGYSGGWNGSANVNNKTNKTLDYKVLPDRTYYYIIDLGVENTKPYAGYMQIKQ